jgi:type I restriction enzyme S subunit
VSLARYSSYKKTGINWLAEIPSHWAYEPLKYSSEIFTGNSLNDSQKQQFESENLNDLPYISSKDIDLLTHTINYENGIKIPADLKGFKVAPKASFLICIEGGSAGKKIAMLDRDVCFVNKLCCIKDKNDARFKYYFFQSKNFKDKFDLSMTGLIGGVSTSSLRNFQIPNPPDKEKLLIIKFLDYELKNIGNLISEQMTLIDLLKEKRQGLISNAVTKGINLSKQMKDSGVTWLGKIPHHWNVSQSRRLFRERKQKAASSERQLTASQKYGVIYQDDFMALEGVSVVQVIHGADILKHVEPNDFVISMRSFQGGIEWCNFSGSISSAYVMLIPNEKVYPGFFKHLFKSNSYIQALQSTTNLVRDGQALRFSNFTLIDLPEVPIEEQKVISDYLDIKLLEFDSLIEQVVNCINLLQERRSALISEAVTGQIDVTNYQIKEAA